MLLTPEEVAALTETFPSLNDWAIVPVELRPASLDQTPPPPDAAVATFRRVPPRHAGRCKDPKVIRRGRLKARARAFAPLVAVFVWIGLAYPFSHALEAIGVEPAPFMMVYVVGIGAVALVVVLRNDNPNEDATYQLLVRYYHGVMLDEARQRDDALFDVDRPGVVYVGMVPRQYWHDIGTREIDDEGALLFVDTDGRRILFEGDRYRW